MKIQLAAAYQVENLFRFPPMVCIRKTLLSCQGKHSSYAIFSGASLFLCLHLFSNFLALNERVCAQVGGEVQLTLCFS